MSPIPRSVAEAERQLAAAAERHAEALASMQAGDRADVSQQAAVWALARRVQLVSFTLARAATAGVPVERMVELTGWDEALVREALAQGQLPVIGAGAPFEGVELRGVAPSAAGFEAAARIETLLQSIVVDIRDEAWSPAGADLDDLGNRLEATWRAWRQGLGRPRE